MFFLAKIVTFEMNIFLIVFFIFVLNQREFIIEILLFIYIFDEICMFYITKLFTIEIISFLWNLLGKY